MKDKISSIFNPTQKSTSKKQILSNVERMQVRSLIQTFGHPLYLVLGVATDITWEISSDMTTLLIGDEITSLPEKTLYFDIIFIPYFLLYMETIN